MSNLPKVTQQDAGVSSPNAGPRPVCPSLGTPNQLEPLTAKVTGLDLNMGLPAGDISVVVLRG